MSTNDDLNEPYENLSEILTNSVEQAEKHYEKVQNFQYVSALGTALYHNRASDMREKQLKLSEKQASEIERQNRINEKLLYVEHERLRAEKKRVSLKELENISKKKLNEKVKTELKRSKEIADKRNRGIKDKFNAINRIVAESVKSESMPDFDGLIKREKFPAKKYHIPEPKEPIFSKSPKLINIPNPPKELPIPQKPSLDDLKYQAQIGILEKIFTKRKEQKIQQSERIYQSDLAAWTEQKLAIEKSHRKKMFDWESKVNEIKNRNSEILIEFELKKHQSVERFKIRMSKWLSAKNEFDTDQNRIRDLCLNRQNHFNEIIRKAKKYFSSKSVDGIEEYFLLVCNQIKFPIQMPDKCSIKYNIDSKQIEIKHHLPSIDKIPDLESVAYCQSSNAVVENKISKNNIKILHHEIIAKIALRTLIDVCRSDRKGDLSILHYSGWVKENEKSTGNKILKETLAIKTRPESILKINAKNVDAQAWLESLGVNMG
jgi:hypothetical protein